MIRNTGFLDPVEILHGDGRWRARSQGEVFFRHRVDIKAVALSVPRLLFDGVDHVRTLSRVALAV